MEVNQNIKVSVDAVVFGYSSSKGLQVLLIKRDIEPFKGSWALPGGLVKNNETLESAIGRELAEETGVSINYLEQLYTFGEPNRDPRNRVVTIAYFGFVKPSKFNIQADTDANDVKWFNIKEIPALAFDHNNILGVALNRVRGKITYEPIGFELIDKKFPFSDLQKLYEVLLDTSLDRRNFKKKILSFGFVEETKERQRMEGSGRPGYLYKFNEKKYFQLKKDGIAFEI
ncbi:MAG: NUDIX domain-containing protein [Bacteroidota bacterium]